MNDIKKEDIREVEIEPFNDLKRRVEITRDARFQSNLRLERRNKTSYLVISVLSLFVIVLSLVPNIFNLSQAATQALLALTIINSVFIIIATFLEASGNFVHRGEQLHRSARKVATVFNQMMLLTAEERRDKNKIQALQKDYQNALDDCPFNHENIDYDLIKATKPELFRNRIYTGNGREIVRQLRYVKYKIYERLWLFPHLIVVVITLLLLYWILVRHGLGYIEVVSAPRR